MEFICSIVIVKKEDIKNKAIQIQTPCGEVHRAANNDNGPTSIYVPL